GAVCGLYRVLNSGGRFPSKGSDAMTYWWGKSRRGGRPVRTPAIKIEELESRALLAASLVADVNRLTAGSLDGFGLTQSAQVGNTLYFTADDGVHGRELWASDGTAAGTHLVKDVSPGNAPSATAAVGPYGLTAVGGT